MILSRKERGRYLREIQRSINELLVPELTSQEAKSLAEGIDRTLTLFIMEQEFGPDIYGEMSDRKAKALSQIAGLLKKTGRAADLLDEIQSALDTVNGGEPGSVMKQLGVLAQKTVLELSGLMESEMPELEKPIVELLSTEKDFQDRIAELRDELSGPETSAADPAQAPVSTTTPQQLTDYLRKRFSECPELRVKGLTPVPGGRSKETDFLKLEKAGDLPEEVVLRKDQAVSIVDSKAADEYAVLDVVYRLGGVPVPKPILVEPDASQFGGTFLIMEKAGGTRQGEFFPECGCLVEDRRAIGSQLAQILGRLHSMDVNAFEGTHHNLRPDLKADLTARIEMIHQRIIDADMPPNASVEFAYHWLLDHLEDARNTEDVSLLQGVLGLHNMLIDGNRITAILDWELVRIGLPASELGDTLHLIEYLMPLDDFKNVYMEHGGKASACDPDALKYYSVLMGMHAATISGLAGHYFRSGAVNDFTYADAGYDLHVRGCKLLTSALGKLGL